MVDSGLVSLPAGAHVLRAPQRTPASARGYAADSLVCVEALVPENLSVSLLPFQLKLETRSLPLSSQHLS